jgi:hypothetical protein
VNTWKHRKPHQKAHEAAYTANLCTELDFCNYFYPFVLIEKFDVAGKRGKQARNPTTLAGS